jgi:hypothetical protein
MTLRVDGKQIKALLPDQVKKDLERLQVHLGMSTQSNVISFAIRRLAIAEFGQQNTTTSLDEPKEAA